MGKAYNSKWKVTPLTVNFNQKQWRQDFGAFIRSKLFWDGTTLVTRSKAKSKGPNLITICKYMELEQLEVNEENDGEKI